MIIQICKEIKKYVIAFVIVFFTAISLLMITNKLSNPQKVINHISESIPVLQREGDYPNDGVAGSQLDNYTDVLMLKTAIDDYDDSTLERSASSPHYSSDGSENLTSSDVLLKLVTGDKKNLNKVEYTRYWHGYLIYLRPLLNHFNYSEIRSILSFVVILLISLVSIEMYKNTLKKYIFPFIITLLSINITSIMKSLQFTTVMIPTLLFIFVLLKYHEKMEEKRVMGVYFFIFGCSISYFDLLTFPIVSIGYVSSFYLLLQKGDYKKRILDLSIMIISWAVGYALMWFSKWVFASIVLQENAIKSSLEAVLFRSGNEFDGKIINYSDVLKVNYNNISKLSIIMAGMYTVYCVLYSLRNKIVLNHLKNNTLILPGLIVSFMPFVWYFVLKNHSYIHSFFTYRGFSVTLLNVLFVATYILTNKSRIPSPSNKTNHILSTENE